MPPQHFCKSAADYLGLLRGALWGTAKAATQTLQKTLHSFAGNGVHIPTLGSFFFFMLSTLVPRCQYCPMVLLDDPNPSEDTSGIFCSNSDSIPDDGVCNDGSSLIRNVKRKKAHRV